MKTERTLAERGFPVPPRTVPVVRTKARRRTRYPAAAKGVIAASSCVEDIDLTFEQRFPSEAAKEAVYLGVFLKELGILPKDQPAHLAVDNTAARDLAYNPQHHDRTKHIARRHFFIREMVESGRLVVPYVRTVDNLADFFTKPLPASVFFAMRDKIMNIKEDSPPSK